jgi:hypothetical protein
VRNPHEGGEDFVGHCALATLGDLRYDAARLMLSEGEEQNGLLVAGELGELAIEADAAHQRGVKAVGAGVACWASGRGVVSDSAATEQGAFVLPVFEADASEGVV